MEFTVRRARPDDAQAILGVLNPLIENGSYTIMDEPLSLQAQIEFMGSFPKRGVFNVAVAADDRTVLGLQDVAPLSSWTRSLKHVGEISTFVALNAQRGGVGSALCQATFQDARAKGYLKLRAIVRADNPQAVAFYTRQGFQVIGTALKHALVGGKYVDEVILEKLLDDPLE